MPIRVVANNLTYDNVCEHVYLICITLRNCTHQLRYHLCTTDLIWDW
jgi:hypothetical protein